jgi:hypothetical protein
MKTLIILVATATIFLVIGFIWLALKYIEGEDE